MNPGTSFNALADPAVLLTHSNFYQSVPFDCQAIDLNVNDLEFLIAKHIIGPANFYAVRDGGRISGEQLVDQSNKLNLDLIVRILKGAASLVFTGLQHVLPHVGRLADRVSDDYGYAVQANAYLTPRGARALRIHVDPYPVFVIQLDGHKDWSYASAPAQPADQQASLSPGTALYLPAQTLHQARCSDHFSLHLTLGIRTDLTAGPDRSVRGAMTGALSAAT
ncbi:JmjC domain-containing protein [Nocardia sp. NPDC004085]